MDRGNGPDEQKQQLTDADRNTANENADAMLAAR
jgi:hypothetical protein